MIDKLSGFKESVFADPKKRAIAALAICVLVFSVVPIFVRLGERQISPTAVIFHRLWIGTIILGIWNGVLSIRSTDFKFFQVGTNRTLGLLLGGGICFGTTQLIWAWSISQTSIANSALMHGLTPLFTTLGGWMLFAQKFDRRFIMGTIVAMIGSMVLGFNDFVGETSKVQGDIIALISALFFAVYFLILEQIRNEFDVITIVFYYCAIGTAMLIPFVFISEQDILPSSFTGWLTIVFLACTLLLVFPLSAYSIKWLTSGLVTVVLMLEPVLSAILAWSVFSEALDLWNLIAFPVVLFGIYLATTSKSVIKDEQLIQ